MKFTRFLVVIGLVLVSLASSFSGTQQTAYAAIPRRGITDHTFANGILFAPSWSYLETKRGDASSNSVYIYAQRVVNYRSNPYISVATYSCNNNSHVRTSNIINIKTGTSGYLRKTSGCFRIMMHGNGLHSDKGDDFRGIITYSVYNG